MSSPPRVSNKEPSIQSSTKSTKHKHRGYVYPNADGNLNGDDVSSDDEATRTLKFSLAHYFSSTFVVFITLLITATIVLFIWSNTSDGAWVSLQVYPILPSDTDSYDAALPFQLSFASKLRSHNASAHNPRSMASLYNALQKNSTELGDLSDLSDLSLNLDIFHFTLVDSVQDFWDSSAYALSILIALFSGIWPYVKLLLLGTVWLVPMRRENREGILVVLDQLGKFSFIDLFVSLYMVVSFYVDIEKRLPHRELGLQILVVVEPDVGLNTFVIGTAVSMLFSHFFLFLDARYAKPHIRRLSLLQRRAREVEVADAEELDDTAAIDLSAAVDRELQMRGAVEAKHSWNRRRRALCLRAGAFPRSILGAVLRGAALMALCLCIFGVLESIWTAPVRYDLHGVVGWAISNPIRAYTPWQIVSEVPTHTDERTAAYPLSLCLALTIMVFPLSLSLSMAALWLCPLRYRHLRPLNVATQTAMAWSALDVFAVASIAAASELDRVSQWIMNATYPGVCGPDGAIPHITNKIFGAPLGCFSVEGNLTWGVAVVVAVALTAWALFVYSIAQLRALKVTFERQCHGKEQTQNAADKTIFFFDH